MMSRPFSLPRNYRFEEYWRLTHTVKNDHEKTVKLIDGALEFSG
jgi:hypothetical protein